MRSGWRAFTIRRVAAVVGFVLGAPCAALMMAVNSDDCAHMSRSLTVFPPGLQCFGPKDDPQVPWGSQGPGAVQLVVLGGLLGAFALLAHCKHDEPAPRFHAVTLSRRCELGGRAGTSI